MANCPGCGSILRFDIKKQKLVCQSCNGKYSPYSIDKVNEAEKSGEDYNINAFVCPNCGGELYSTDYDLSGNCSYCGSPVVFDVRMKNEKRPKYIIPFTRTKEDCKEAYLKAIGKCFFAPGELKNPDYIDGFRGIYVPYWLYDVELDGEPFDLETSHSYTSGDYDYTEVYNIKGKNYAHYNEIPHDASSVLSDDISESVEPFHLRDSKKKTVLKEFTPSYFSGFYAEPADVAAENYQDYARSVAEDQTKVYLDEESPVSQFKISGKMKAENLKTQVKNVNLALFPVWFLSLRKGKRVSYAAVNGQTGRLVSDLPIDLKKVFLSMALGSIILFVLMSFMTMLPRTVTMLAVVTSFITARLCRDDVNLLIQREQNGGKSKRNKNINSIGTLVIFVFIIALGLIIKFSIFIDDDLSFLSSNLIYALIGLVLIVFQIKMIISMMKKIKVLAHQKYYGVIFPFLCLASSCYGTYTLFKNPFEDAYYYAATAVVIAITLISMLGLILNYNRVASRPLPQFKIHKGGDDRA